jgi:hypothetical protein
MTVYPSFSALPPYLPSPPKEGIVSSMASISPGMAQALESESEQDILDDLLKVVGGQAIDDRTSDSFGTTAVSMSGASLETGNQSTPSPNLSKRKYAYCFSTIFFSRCPLMPNVDVFALLSVVLQLKKASISPLFQKPAANYDAQIVTFAA